MIVSGSYGIRAILIAAAFAAILSTSNAAAQTDTATVTQTLNVQIQPTAKLSVPASMSLTSVGTVFNSYNGSLTISFRVRSSSSGSGGSVTVSGTANFSPAGGPSISSGTLNYTCTAPTLGTACSGTNTISLTSSTNVLAIPPSSCTGGGSPCSTADPNTVNLILALPNDPAYRTGSYSASLTFTISST